MKNLKALLGQLEEVRKKHESAAKKHDTAMINNETAMAELALIDVHHLQHQEFFLARRLHEIYGQKTLISEFEKRTELEFNALGPLLAKCDRCGLFFQFIPEHVCNDAQDPFDEVPTAVSISSGHAVVPLIPVLRPPSVPDSDIHIRETPGPDEISHVNLFVTEKKNDELTAPPTPTPIDNT
jgi:hypothetical protein